MIETVQSLARARETLADANTSLETAIAAMYATPEGARVLDAKEKQQAAQEAANLARVQVAQAALQAHADTGSPWRRA